MFVVYIWCIIVGKENNGSGQFTSGILSFLCSPCRGNEAAQSGAGENTFQ
jgi:hypothetical protein